MNRTENKSTFDYWLRFLEVREEKINCFLLKILSQRFTQVVRGSDN